MASISVYLRQKSKTEHKFSAIYLKIAAFGEVWRISLNLTIENAHWDNKNLCAAFNAPTREILFQTTLNYLHKLTAKNQSNFIFHQILKV